MSFPQSHYRVGFVTVIPMPARSVPGFGTGFRVSDLKFVVCGLQFQNMRLVNICCSAMAGSSFC